MSGTYQFIHEAFSLFELTILHLALLAFLVVGIWRILCAEIAHARRAVAAARGEPVAAPELKT